VVHPEHHQAARIAEALTADGHEVTVVPDGERAIDRFIQRPTDALIVEMVLPGRDGGTTVESVRWAPRGGEAGVVLLGSRGTPRDSLVKTAKQVRARAAIPGPVDVSAVRSVIADIAGGGMSTRSAQSPPSKPSSGEVWTDQTTRPGDRREDEDRGPPVIAPPAAPLPGSAESLLKPLRTGAPGWEEELFTDVDEELTGNWTTGDFPGGESEGADVERRASSAATTEDELVGDLRDTPFPRLLHLLALSKRNGAMVLSSVRDRRRTTTGESPKKVVFFRSGVPRYVQSNLVQECLGQVMARGGMIGHSVLEESVRRMRRGEGRQGGVLLSMGAITPHQLRDGLEDQLRVKLFDLFAWSQGRYHFIEDEKAPPETVTLEMSLPEIVVKGVVHRIPPQRLLDLLSPHLDEYVVPDKLRLGRFSRVELAPEAKQVLHSLDGTKRLSAILQRAGARPGAAAQLLYALSCLDAVRFTPDPEPTSALSERELRDSSAITMHIATLREDLSRLGRLLRAESYAEALGVSPDDPTEAIRRADALRARFHPVTEPGAAPRELRALAFEVCARLVHAREALGAPEGSRRSPLQLARDAFDGDIPTRDEKKKRAGEGSVQEPDEFLSATPSDSGPTAEERAERPTVPEKPSAEPPTASREMPTAVGRMNERVPDDFAEQPPTMASDELAPDADVPPPRLGRPPPPRIGRPASPARISALVPEEDERGSFETDPEEDETTSRGRAIAEGEDAEFDDTTREDDGPPPEVESSLDEQVERLYQAERHFRRGERALRRQKTADAVSAFERAVDLCPDEGEFVSHLGYAKYMAAETETEKAAAVAELELGATLAPKIDITHLLLARVLADREERAAARDSYGRALAANPDCEEALSGLKSLGEG
jgi:CheY-like chemotaxis protein